MAFLYFDSTAVYVHIVHWSSKESYNSHLIILILIQNFMFIHKNLIWIINIGFGIGKSVILRYLYDSLVLLLLTYTKHDCALRCSDWELCLFWLIAFVLINCLLFDLLYCVCTMYSIYKQVDVSKEQHREEKRDSISNKNTNNLSKQTLLVQANNFEIVVIFFHISHNLTWYSAIVHKFTRVYQVCSTYELTKQFM